VLVDENVSTDGWVRLGLNAIAVFGEFSFGESSRRREVNDGKIWR